MDRSGQIAEPKLCWLDCKRRTVWLGISKKLLTDLDLQRKLTNITKATQMSQNKDGHVHDVRRANLAT